MFSILYVDDEPTLLEIGKLFLEEKGVFAVETVTSAPKALLKIAAKKYDAIISDYQMPEMDGIEFLKRVRASGNTVPFIIFTGRGREEIVIQAINEGADFYLQKGGEPVSQFAELEHKVQTAVMQRRAEASVRDYERREADIINFLPDATFAVDIHGGVIAWNRAMEIMTGVKSSEILGKDNYEYAIPFYHERRPILIDLVLKDDPITSGKYPSLTREGTSLFSEITIPYFNNGSGAVLWFTASPLFDRQGTIVGAIESIREITERKQAEEALQESEKRFRELSDLLPQIVYEIDTNGNLLYANQIAFEWFGYTEDEFHLGLNILQMIVPDDRERAAAAFRSLVEGTGRAGIADEYQAIRKDGRIFPINVYTSTVIVNGRINGLRGIIVDITERKKAEYNLKNTVAFLNSLIEQSPTPMWISNDKGILIIINKACCDLLHIDEADVVGKYSIFEDTMVIEQGFLPRVRDVFEKGNVARFQIKYDTKQLKNLQLDEVVTLILDVTIFPVRNTGGKITNAVIQHTNITERKKAENAVHESEQRYRNIVEDQTEFISRFLPNGTHVFVNEAYCRYFGLKREEILGHRFRPKIPAEDLERVEQFFKALTADHSVDIIEHRIIMPDGSIRWQRWSDRAIFDESGAILEYQSVGRDITENKQAEMALRESENRLRAIMQSIPTGIVILDAETHEIIEANPKALEMIGAKHSEVVGSVCHRFICPSKEGQCPVSDRGITIDSSESVLLTSSQRQVPVLKTVIPVTIGGKKVLLESFSDITELKRKEDRIRVLAGLLDLMPASVTVHRPDGTFLYANAKTFEYHGFTEEEFYTLNLHELDVPESEQLINERIRKMKETGEISFEVRHLRKDRSVIPLLINARMTIWDGSHVILSIASDLTESKKAENALRKTEERLRLTFEATNDGIWDWDIPTGNAVFSPHYYTMLGYEPYEFLENYTSWRSLVHPDDIVKAENEIQDCLTKGNAGYSVELRIRTKDGNWKWILTRGKVVERDPAGQPVRMVGTHTDISDRKKAEEDLVTWYLEYKTLLEQIQDVYYRSDTEGHLVQGSRSMAEMFGYSSISEIIGKNIAQEFYLLPEDRKRFLEEVYRNGKVRNYEVYLKKKDGSPVLISASSHLLYNPDGTIGGIEGTFRDITEQKQTGDALRQRTEELDYRNRVFSTLLETVPIGIFMVEATSGKPIIANREASLLLGRGILPDSSEDNLAEFYEAYKAGTSMRYPTQEMPVVRGMHGKSSHVDDMVVVRPDGSKIQLEIFGTPVIDKQGRVAASLVSFIDITERKQIEETIQRLAQFSGQNPNPVLRIDMDGTLLYANNQGLEWLAASGKNAGQQLPDSIRSIVTDALNKKSIIKREVEFQDGTNRVFEVTAIRPGEESYVNIYGSDITERKRAERTIQETNKKVNLLTSITRHDVANQVSVLRGYAKIAKMKKPDPIVVDLLEKIDTAGSTIARQIAFTEAYQELGMHAPAWYQISDIIAQQKPEGISLACTCEAKVFADPMLEKVFSNLIDNAGRHGEHVTMITISCRIEPDGLLISVEDNGVGVPLDLKKKIFDKGYGKHTGFGLFLAREILAITGMTIHETGVVGKGARFEILVPKGSYRNTKSIPDNAG